MEETGLEFELSTLFLVETAQGSWYRSVSVKIKIMMMVMMVMVVVIMKINDNKYPGLL